MPHPTDVRQVVHPADAARRDTAGLRREFLIETVFAPDAVRLTYSHLDRVVVGGALPVAGALELEAPAAIGTTGFLDRRELAVINIGGPGTVTVGGESVAMAARDGLYIGQGAGTVRFASASSDDPARFYLVSAPAHQSHPLAHIPFDRARKVKAGSPTAANARTICQYVHPDVCGSCQLLVGLTVLESGSVWNTMPPHLHDRRCEVYLYCDMEPSTRVFHLMGEPHETRHLVVANEQAVLSPGWSIHSGCGTGRYTFVWAMAGDNQDFTDMDMVPMEVLA